MTAEQHTPGPDPRPRSGLTTTATSLTLHRPVADLPSAERTAVRQWLEAHGIDPALVVVDRPFVRDPHRRLLRWTEHSGHDLQLVRTLRAPPGQDRRDWPLPFPPDLHGPAAFTDPDGYTFLPG